MDPPVILAQIADRVRINLSVSEYCSAEFIFEMSENL